MRQKLLVITKEKYLMDREDEIGRAKVLLNVMQQYIISGIDGQNILIAGYSKILGINHLSIIIAL